MSLEFKKFSTKFFTDLLFKVLRDCITADDPLYGFCFLGAERAAAVLVTVSKAVELDFFFARSMVVNLMPNHTLARYVVNQLNRMTIAKGIGVAARVALVADASASRLLRSLGVNFNRVDGEGNNPLAESAALMALFALGATMTGKNLAGVTPYEQYLESHLENADALLTFVAAGLCCDVCVETQLSSDKAALVIAGGGLVSVKADPIDLLRALNRIVERQKQLFRARAFHVCVGLRSLRLSALEMCEILTNLFAPLESLVPMHFAWRVVCAVRHFQTMEERN